MLRLTALFAFTLLLGLPRPAHAQNAKGHTIVVFAENGERFFLVLDGQKVNDKPLARVTAPGLMNGYYRSKIIFDDEKLPDINQSIQCDGVDPGYNEVVYRIRKKMKKGKPSWALVMSSFRKIGDKDGDVSERPNPNTATANEMESSTGGHPPITGSPGMNPAPVMPSGTPTSPTGQPLSPTGTALVPCEPPTSVTDFRQAISAQSFREERLDIARQILHGNCLTTEQVKSLTDLFTFEEDRLDFVKAAYDKVVDKGNYYKINSVFTFSASVDELKEYLATKK